MFKQDVFAPFKGASASPRKRLQRPSCEDTRQQAWSFVLHAFVPVFPSHWQTLHSTRGLGSSHMIPDVFARKWILRRNILGRQRNDSAATFPCTLHGSASPEVATGVYFGMNGAGVPSQKNYSSSSLSAPPYSGPLRGPRRAGVGGRRPPLLPL